MKRVEVDGTRGRGRPRTRWRDIKRNVHGEKGMSIQQAERCVQDRKNREYMVDK